MADEAQQGPLRQDDAGQRRSIDQRRETALRERETVAFIDPRTDPDPSAPRPPARFTAEPDELAEFHRLCREGRLYDIERWIRSGRPLQLTEGIRVSGRRQFRTALQIAFDRQDHSLLLLLVANGYDLEAEPENPLDTALRSRRRDLLDLLLDWGADPRRVDPYVVCDTYDSALYERFRSFGVELTSDHALAYALGEHPGNKPLFGFAKRHRLQEPRVQADLDIALAYHAGEGNEKGVMLCLWAGADPHARVPSLRWGLQDDEDEDDWQSAVHEACWHGHVAILERLRPEPAQDDFQDLYRSAPNEGVVELLARSALPDDPATIIRIQLARAARPFLWERPVETLRALFDAGVRWRSSPPQDLADARRNLLRTEDWIFGELMRLLTSDDFCSREVLTELARTASMRERMKRVGLLPATSDSRDAWSRARPAGARAILEKLGVERPKPRPKPKPRPLDRTVRIGPWRRDGIETRLDRRLLFERVWSTPVEKLAQEWGISGRGLAKACRRLRLPVPPRGYWARVAAGQRPRRPQLLKLPPGQAEEILIYAPRRAAVE